VGHLLRSTGQGVMYDGPSLPPGVIGPIRSAADLATQHSDVYPSSKMPRATHLRRKVETRPAVAACYFCRRFCPILAKKRYLSSNDKGEEALNLTASTVQSRGSHSSVKK